MTKTTPAVTSRDGDAGDFATASKRSDELLDLLSNYSAAVVVCHDYPDPDAIAAGWAIRQLAVEKLRIPTRLVARGQILRPENRCLMGLLRPPLELVRGEAEVPGDAATVLVDCDPRASNHLLGDSSGRVLAVVDHHSAESAPLDICFVDIRPDVAATASIAAQYLREQLLVPDEQLATAMLYALRTETRGGEIAYTPFDHRILTWLTGIANPTWLAKIETAPFHCSHLSNLAVALDATAIYGDVAFCFFPDECQAGLVAEVADMLIRCEQLRYVFCGATFGGDVLISVRTDRTEAHAGRLVQRLVDGLGRGGGHQHRAGAKIPNATEMMAGSEQLCRELRERWLLLCGAENRLAKPLVQSSYDHVKATRGNLCRSSEKTL